MSNFGRGDVLRAMVTSDSYATAYHDPRGPTDPPIPLPAVPYLKISAVAGEGGGLTLFALNRDLTGEVALDVSARGFGPLQLSGATTLHDADLKAANTSTAPERIKPRALEGIELSSERVPATLPPASWTTIRLAPGI